MTTETLWPILDAAIVSLIDAEMGTGSGYADNQLQSVDFFDTWGPDKGPFPRAIVSSNRITPEPGAHGDGLPHFDIGYTYELVAVQQATSYADARIGAQILLARLRETMRNNFDGLLGLAGDDGETSQNVAWGEWLIEVRGRNNPGATAGKQFGIAVLSFTVEATI